jgi:hypothetical protein
MQTAEIFLGHVRASAVQRVRLLMVDELHFEARVKVVPRDHSLAK